MGYQIQPPQIDQGGFVEVNFIDGDQCLEKTIVPNNYLTKIKFECDYSKYRVYIN